jgi:uncharacterized protein YbdZ (MbtH family)
MGTFRRSIGIVIAAAVVGVAVIVASSGDSSPASTNPGAFSWVRPTALPASWDAVRLPDSPASLPIPAGWHVAHGDPGTQTAELTGPGGTIDGYLNATPQQGEERLGNWDEFRVDHNRDEEDHDVKLLASATDLHFAGATGSCVIDAYVTSSDHRYREIACIVAGASTTTVIVAAAPPQRWQAEKVELQRAITSFTT